jgi:hypothetical protein
VPETEDVLATGYIASAVFSDLSLEDVVGIPCRATVVDKVRSSELCQRRARAVLLRQLGVVEEGEGPVASRRLLKVAHHRIRSICPTPVTPETIGETKGATSVTVLVS